jgi:adenylate cyclase class IV
VKTKLIGSSRLKKKGSLVKARLKDKRIAKRGGSSSTKEPKLTAMNTVFLDLRTSIEDCEKVIKAFNRLGYTTYYDSKTKTLKTTAPKTRIKEFSKLFKCIQSYSLIQKLK